MSTRKHVVFVSVPILSHITSLFHLAKKISVHHDVTFLISAVRATQLQFYGALGTGNEHRITFVAVKDGLTLNDVSQAGVAGLFHCVNQSLEILKTLAPKIPVKGQPVSNEFLKALDQQISRPADVFLGDFIAMMNLAEFLKPRGVPVFAFDACPAYIFTNKISIDDKTPLLPDEAFFSDWESHPDLSLTGVPARYGQYMADRDEKFEMLDVMIFNSVAELEPDTERILRAHPSHRHYKIRFIAPLFSMDSLVTARDQPVMEWMNKQAERSVVYIAFGSTITLPKEQVAEIAKALVSLKKPFLWALKPEEQEHLPEEMKASMKTPAGEQEFLVLAWAPQIAILCHKVTAVFLMHGGWCSLLESLSNGVPMVSWPLLGDQYGNAKMVERLGAGVTIPNTTMMFTNVIPAKEIVTALEKVGGWEGDGESSNRYAEQAKGAKKLLRNAVAPGGSSDKGLQDLVHDISTVTGQ